MAMSPDKPARAVFELRLVGRAGQAGIHDLRAPPARAECRPVRTARSWRGIVSFTHLAREGCMTVTIRRRELLAALGSAAVAWPLSARAQQSGMPVIGFLNGASPEAYALYATAFRQGLTEARYVEGQNATIAGHHFRFSHLKQQARRRISAARPELFADIRWRNPCLPSISTSCRDADSVCAAWQRPQWRQPANGSRRDRLSPKRAMLWTLSVTTPPRRQSRSISCAAMSAFSRAPVATSLC